MEKLIQVRVDEKVKDSCDALFAEEGMTTQQAVKIFLYHVAKSGQSPFENIFTRYASRENLKMVAESGVEYVAGEEGVKGGE